MREPNDILHSQLNAYSDALVYKYDTQSLPTFELTTRTSSSNVKELLGEPQYSTD